MAVNKVVFGNETLIDITDSTVTPTTLSPGVVAYNAAGERIVGANPDVPLNDCNAITTAGTYLIASDALNKPMPDDAGWITVHTSGQNYFQQFVTISGFEFTRTGDAQGWREWVKKYNIIADDVEIHPTANRPTALHINFGRTLPVIPIVQLTPYTTVPGTTVLGVGSANLSTTGFDIYLTRTNSTMTVVHWTAFY